MKLAAVHCRIAQGGALDVFKDLIKEELVNSDFSDVKIFTSYSELKTIKINNKHIKIITALPKWLNTFFQRNTKKKIPILGQIFDYRNLMLFYPIIMKVVSRKIKKYKPESIIISSFAIAKNIEQCKITNSGSKTKTKQSKLYLHSPMQYIRSHKKEYTKKLTGWKGRIFRNIISNLQKRDLEYTKYDKIYANSNYTKTLAKEIYNIKSEIKYPKLNQIFFNENIVVKPKEYVICTGRLVKFVKEIDTIIKAFNNIGYPLILIGSGPDEKELKKLAKSNITFTGRNPPNMIEIIKNAKGSINLTKESFGLSTAESLCLGVPVLGYRQGATDELIDNNSGITIEDKSDLTKSFQSFITKDRDRKKISSNARQKFSSK